MCRTCWKHKTTGSPSASQNHFPIFFIRNQGGFPDCQTLFFSCTQFSAAHGVMNEKARKNTGDGSLCSLLNEISLVFHVAQGTVLCVQSSSVFPLLHNAFHRLFIRSFSKFPLLQEHREPSLCASSIRAQGAVRDPCAFINCLANRGRIGYNRIVEYERGIAHAI